MYVEVAFSHCLKLRSVCYEHGSVFICRVIRLGVVHVNVGVVLVLVPASGGVLS